MTFFAWHLFGAMKSQSMIECTETIVSGTLSNAENSHHLRWKSYIRTDIATHSALLAACCCTPVMNLRCELWFNTLISTLILVWALKGCHIHISYGNCSETCMLMTGKIKRNFLWKSGKAVAASLLRFSILPINVQRLYSSLLPSSYSLTSTWLTCLQ